MKPRSIERLTVEHALGVVAEWTAIIGVLTYAYERSGARGTGIASLFLLLAHILSSPAIAALLVRTRPLLLRRAAFALETAFFSVAAAVAVADGPLPIVVGATALAIGAIGVLRPSAAMLLPWSARTTRDLIRGNLLSSYTESVTALIGPLLASGLVALGGHGSATRGLCRGDTAGVGPVVCHEGSGP